MDEATLNVNRFEAEGRASFDRWSVSMLYGNYAAAAGTRIPDPPRRPARQRIGQGGVELGGVGAARWDLEANKLNQYIVGAGYVDDCFVLAANYVTSYSYSAGTTPPVLSHAFMLQIGLRTIAQFVHDGRRRRHSVVPRPDPAGENHRRIAVHSNRLIQLT